MIDPRYVETSQRYLSGILCLRLDLGCGLGIGERIRDQHKDLGDQGLWDVKECGGET